jgi:hypothetical protein
LLITVFNAALTYVTEIPPDLAEQSRKEIAKTHPEELPDDRESIFGIKPGKSVKKNLEILRKGEDKMEASLPVIVSLAIIMAASLFRFFFRRWKNTFPLVSQSDRIYLFCVGARLFLPVTLYGLFNYLMEMTLRYEAMRIYLIKPVNTLIIIWMAESVELAGFRWKILQFLSPEELAVSIVLSLLRLGLLSWVVIALWKSTTVIADVLQLKGERKGRRVKGRRVVTVRLFGAQIITLITARIIYVSILLIYVAIHI